MKTCSIFAILITIVSLSSLTISSANAGKVVPTSGVGIQRIANGASIFSGSLIQVRHSLDSTQWIGCSENGRTAKCDALDANGTLIACFTSKKDLIKRIHTFSENDLINITVDKNGICTQIESSRFSYYQP